MKNFDIILVGDGLAARLLLYEMSQRQSFLDKKILQISSPINFPECSTRTTSVVSGGVHEKGISKLGDLLVDSYNSFTSFVNEYNDLGMFCEKSPQYYVFDEHMTEHKKEMFLKRFGHELEDFQHCKVASKQSYLVFSEKLLSFLKDLYVKKLNLTHVKETYIEHKESALRTDVSTYNGDKIILATGAYSSFFEPSLDTKLGKAVSGSYLKWDNISLDIDNFVFSKGHFNLIHRKSKGELLFGGTSFEGHIHAHNLRELKSEFSLFKDMINFDLDVQNANVITGLRHKCSKRLPVCKKINANTYVFSGFYKNGFTFPFYLKKILIDLLD